MDALSSARERLAAFTEQPEPMWHITVEVPEAVGTARREELSRAVDDVVTAWDNDPDGTVAERRSCAYNHTTEAWLSAALAKVLDLCATTDTLTSDDVADTISASLPAEGFVRIEPSQQLSEEGTEGCGAHSSADMPAPGRVSVTGIEVDIPLCTVDPPDMFVFMTGIAPINDLHTSEHPQNPTCDRRRPL